MDLNIYNSDFQFSQEEQNEENEINEEIEGFEEEKLIVSYEEVKNTFPSIIVEEFRKNEDYSLSFYMKIKRMLGLSGVDVVIYYFKMLKTDKFLNFTKKSDSLTRFYLDQLFFKTKTKYEIKQKISLVIKIYEDKYLDEDSLYIFIRVLNKPIYNQNEVKMILTHFKNLENDIGKKTKLRDFLFNFSMDKKNNIL